MNVWEVEAELNGEFGTQTKYYFVLAADLAGAQKEFGKKSKTREAFERVVGISRIGKLME